MVSSQFEEILKDFEPFFNCSLKPDANDSCLIKMTSGVNIQIELNSYGSLIIGCRIAALQMGRFREQVIQEALKANSCSSPFSGSFGYSSKSQNLILFIIVDPKELEVNKILDLMQLFTTKAQLWVEALAKGELPVLSFKK